MKKLLLLLTLLLWLPIAQANEAKIKIGIDAYNYRDYKTAFTILEPFAKQGHADAQFHLGLMYNKGKGVPQNSAKALKWARKAARQGHFLARDYLSREVIE